MEPEAAECVKTAEEACWLGQRHRCVTWDAVSSISVFLSLHFPKLFILNGDFCANIPLKGLCFEKEFKQFNLFYLSMYYLKQTKVKVKYKM